MASQEDGQPTMRQTDLMKAFNVFSATTNVAAYQRKLPELAQAYMQVGFELAQRLSQIKSFRNHQRIRRIRNKAIRHRPKSSYSEAEVAMNAELITTEVRKKAPLLRGAFFIELPTMF
jgi:hypothetical protein